LTQSSIPEFSFPHITASAFPYPFFSFGLYNTRMAIGIFLMHVLDVIFFVGLAGSSFVVIYSFIEDTVELFEKDEPPLIPGATPTATRSS